MDEIVGTPQPPQFIVNKKPTSIFLAIAISIGCGQVFSLDLFLIAAAGFILSLFSGQAVGIIYFFILGPLLLILLQSLGLGFLIITFLILREPLSPEQKKKHILFFILFPFSSIIIFIKWLFATQFKKFGRVCLSILSALPIALLTYLLSTFLYGKILYTNIISGPSASILTLAFKAEAVGYALVLLLASSYFFYLRGKYGIKKIGWVLIWILFIAILSYFPQRNFIKTITNQDSSSSLSNPAQTITVTQSINSSPNPILFDIPELGVEMTVPGNLGLTYGVLNYAGQHNSNETDVGFSSQALAQLQGEGNLNPAYCANPGTIGTIGKLLIHDRNQTAFNVSSSKIINGNYVYLSSIDTPGQTCSQDKNAQDLILKQSAELRTAFQTIRAD